MVTFPLSHRTLPGTIDANRSDEGDKQRLIPDTEAVQFIDSNMQINDGMQKNRIEAMKWKKEKVVDFFRYITTLIY